MDTYSKVLSKSSVSWTDVQKNIKVAIQGRNFSVNKFLIKQCTDILVKHIKSKFVLTLIKVDLYRFTFLFSFQI